MNHPMSLGIAAMLVFTLHAHSLAREDGSPFADAAITESSGLAPSLDGSTLWTIQDSGNDPVLYGIAPDGGGRGQWPIVGAENDDWEDLAIAPEFSGPRQLLIADIGGNAGNGDQVTLYLIPEPDPSDPGSALSATAFTFVYPDGPHDAEAILVHPVTAETLIVTKSSWGRAAVYTVRWDQPPLLERLGDVNGPGIGPFGQITGGAVSVDGRHAALLTYSGIVEWDIAPGESLATALAGASRSLPHPRLTQTEAIAYSADGATLYVTSEGDPSRIAAIPLDPDR